MTQAQLKRLIYLWAAVVVSLVLLLSSCRTIKEVERTKIVVDSAAIKELTRLQHVHSSTIESYEKRLSEKAGVEIIFDTIPGDTIRQVVTFYDNGKVKQIEGQLLSVRQQLEETTAETYDYASTVDSQAVVIEQLQVELSKKATQVIKYVDRKSVPFWIWPLMILCLVVGWKIKEWHINYSQKKQIQ